MNPLGSVVFVRRSVKRRLEEVAEELSLHTRKEWDADSLASAVLEEFCRIHFEDSTRAAVKIIRNYERGIEDEKDESIRYKFFR